MLPGCTTDKYCLKELTPEPPSTSICDLRIVVVTAKDTDKSKVRDLVEEASQALFAQTGIRASVRDWITIEWRTSSRSLAVQQLADRMKEYDKQFDVAIGYLDMDLLQRLAFNVTGGWSGAIDDVYRKYIVIRRDEVHVLVHELGHAFLFEHVHTGNAMTAFAVCAFGDHFCLNNSLCFGQEDLAAIAQNKWRYFSEVVPLSERQDLINGYFYVKPVLRYLYDLIIGRDRSK
jgi:hypothetical protein